jgi:hypothetical protein
MNNSVYTPQEKEVHPQSFGNSVVRDRDPSRPRRDRVERVNVDIELKETSRPRQKPNKKREILQSRSRSRTIEKATQTPEK